MRNYKKMISEINRAFSVQNTDKAIEIAKELEIILQKNIAIDEINLENNIPLEFVKINESIKDAIFNAYLGYCFTKRTEEIKVYLDDKRSTPDGYVRAFWPKQVFEFLENCKISELSLDHDLGDDEIGTGNDVVCYVEEKVYFNRDYHLPVIKVHSDNSSAKDKMYRGIKHIENLKNMK